ncbi:MAG: DUF2585 family protein [Myxococcota bacterium]
MNLERLRHWRPAILGVLGVCVAAAVALTAMGRVPWCKCASPSPWSWDIWSLHNSQHLLDPYTFSHMLHGVVFYGLLFAVLRGRYPRVAVVIAAGLEAAWELLENTESVIQHYRETTISLDYYGDSVANSVSDILACVAGYALAAAVPWWVSVVGFAVTELMLAAWIKDSLLLNVLMLVYPLDVVKQWQMGE